MNSSKASTIILFVSNKQNNLSHEGMEGGEMEGRGMEGRKNGRAEEWKGEKWKGEEWKW